MANVSGIIAVFLPSAILGEALPRMIRHFGQCVTQRNAVPSKVPPVGLDSILINFILIKILIKILKIILQILKIILQIKKIILKIKKIILKIWIKFYF